MGNKQNNNRRVTKKQVGNKTTGTVIQHESSIQKEEIKDAILLALREYDKEKTVFRDENDVPSQKRGFWSTFGIIVCMPFARRKTINGSKTMALVATLVLSIIFNMLRWMSLVLATTVVGYIVFSLLHETPSAFLAVKIVVLLAMTIVSYMFSGVFRRVSVEVENIKDETLLFAFFAAVGTWVSIVVTLIAIYK